MPEIPYEVYRQISKELGSGAEKVVYATAAKEDESAIGIYHKEKESPMAAKGRYYLTKIFYLLFPEHVINMHLSSSDPNIIVMDKVNFIGAQEELSASQTLTKELQLSLDDRLSSLAKDSGIIEKFQTAGMSNLDSNVRNFGMAEDGTIKYCDTLAPWERIDDRLLLRYDSTRISEAIIKKLHGEEQSQALKYLERLNKLFEQEKQDIIAQYDEVSIIKARNNITRIYADNGVTREEH